MSALFFNIIEQNKKINNHITHQSKPSWLLSLDASISLDAIWMVGRKEAAFIGLKETFPWCLMPAGCGKTWGQKWNCCRVWNNCSKLIVWRRDQPAAPPSLQACSRLAASLDWGCCCYIEIWTLIQLAIALAPWWWNEPPTLPFFWLKISLYLLNSVRDSNTSVFKYFTFLWLLC